MNTKLTRRVATSAVPIGVATAILAGCSWPTSHGESTGNVDDSLDLLSEIEVSVEDTGYHYDRDDWPHWSSVGGGCDVRDSVLQEQGRDVTVGDKCKLTGTWESPYDAVTATDTGELQIDHVVPLAEAARSGVRDWTKADRERYANDERYLLAVTASSNQSKSDSDPHDWLPPEPTYRCEYVALWVEAKHTYDLTMDKDEYDKVSGILERC